MRTYLIVVFSILFSTSAYAEHIKITFKKNFLGFGDKCPIYTEIVGASGYNNGRCKLRTIRQSDAYCVDLNNAGSVTVTWKGSEAFEIEEVGATFIKRDANNNRVCTAKGNGKELECEVDPSLAKDSVYKYKVIANLTDPDGPCVLDPRIIISNSL